MANRNMASPNILQAQAAPEQLMIMSQPIPNIIIDHNINHINKNPSSSPPPSSSSPSSILASEFSISDSKIPLSSLPSSNISHGSLFGAARGIISTATTTSAAANSASPSLQLGANSSSTMFFETNGNSDHINGLSSASMSATALLQKAAQMGATASGNGMNMNMINMNMNNAAMMQQRSFVITSMAPPSLSTAMQQQRQQNDQMGQFFINANGDQFGMLCAGATFDQKKGKGPTTTPTGGENRSPLSGFSGGGGDDMTTVDFLGIGGSRARNLHEQQQHNYQHHQEMDQFVAVIGEPRSMQGLNHFHEQHTAVGKTMWQV